MNRKYDFKRVNKFNLCILLFSSVVLVLQAFALSGKERGLVVLLATSIACMVAFLIVFFKIPQKVASILIPMCPLVVVSILMVQDGGSAKALVSLLVTFTMVALYFDKNLLIVYGVISNVFYIVINLVLGLDVIGKDVPANQLITLLIISDLALLILYFLTKWGNDYVQAAFKSEEKSALLLHDLEKIMKTLEEMTEGMSDDLNRFRNSVESSTKVSNVIMNGMNEMSSGVEEGAITISSITESMKGIQEKINQTNSISSDIEKLSKEVNEVVKNNGKYIEIMHSSMDTIETSVKQNLSTVKELDRSMEEISTFLSAITGIARQTTLLALNASIEAARAGEAGKGFTVVADEIRKLSEESRRVASDIGKIIAVLRSKTEEVLNVSEHGTMAVIEGDEIVDKLKASISGMIISFDTMLQHINNEHTSLDEISKLYNKVQESLENNSAIMEEQSATTQIITSSLIEHDKSINQMAVTIKNIEKMGIELKNLAKSQSSK